jgi:tetrahydromethanopterin S-methyltransferase subunit G
MTLRKHLIRYAVLFTGILHSTERNERGGHLFEDRTNPQNNFGESYRLQHDKRLGVPVGILWGIVISLLLWVLIRWALGAAIRILAGL